MSKGLWIVAVLAVAMLLWLRFGRADAAAVTALPAGALLVDVRTAGERAGGHLAGDVHADPARGGVEALLASEPRERPVVFYCASGVRSAAAVRAARGMGFTDVSNAGGFGALARAGAPVAE